MTRISAFLVVVFCFFSTSWATNTSDPTSGPPFFGSDPPERLLFKAPTIVLARAVSPVLTDVHFPGSICSSTEEYFRFCDHIAQPKANIAAFEVIEVLKGNAPARFTLPNSILFRIDHTSTPMQVQNHFEDHTHPEFWVQFGGRVSSRAEYFDYTAGFVEGEIYLLFPDYGTDKSYELIRSEDDKWLNFVRNFFENFEHFKKYYSSDEFKILDFYEKISRSEYVYIIRMPKCSEKIAYVDETLIGEPITAFELSLDWIKLCTGRPMSVRHRQYLLAGGLPLRVDTPLYRHNIYEISETGEVLGKTLDYGFQFSLEDFGGGASSLNDLSTSPRIDDLRKFLENSQ